MSLNSHISVEEAGPELPLNLLKLLSNPLILHNTTPLIPTSSLLALGAASKAFKELVHHTRRTFRYIDLSENKIAHQTEDKIDYESQLWRNSQGGNDDNTKAEFVLI
jgi:hypothetical protein